MSNEKNQPLETIRDGALKVTIWRNDSENGKFFSATVSRTYKDGEEYKDANSFSDSDLLKLSHMMGQAYERMKAFRIASKALAQAQAENVLPKAIG